MAGVLNDKNAKEIIELDYCGYTELCFLNVINMMQTIVEVESKEMNVDSFL